MPEIKDPYRDFRAALEAQKWPCEYLFKFIIPIEKTEALHAIESHFSAFKEGISRKASAKGNYLALSIKGLMETPEAVIEHYRFANGFEGVISL